MSGPPRLLRGIGDGAPVGHARHQAIHGPLPPPRGLIEACERAGLAGRGGAGFPTATKLRAVAAARGRAIVVVNAAEGEPMSAKDRALLEHVPHLVLDGAVAAAGAVDAGEIVVAVAARRPAAAVTAALAERSDAPAISVATVPHRFVTGQETALLQALEGRPALPTLVPPRPAERGLRRRPTLVQNAETLADLALIARGDDDATALVTLGGCVARPGVHEVAAGASLPEAVAAAGGYSETPRTVLLGGYHGTWVEPGDVTQPARAGAGVIAALPAGACPVAEVARVLAWLAGETAGQCGPCVHGLAAIAAEVAALRDGTADATALPRLRRWSGQLAGRGACHHPDGTTRFLAGALDVFEAEFELHRRFGRCEACDGAAVLAA